MTLTNSFTYRVYEREAIGDDPAGLTIARGELPAGDFMLTEFCWGETVLWFVAEDHFTADERELVYRTLCGDSE